jgi:hypothetical protein
MELQPYRKNMTIKYRAGRINANADPLSRAPLPYDSSDDDEELPQPGSTAPPQVNLVRISNASTTISIDPTFLDRVRKGYKQDITMRKFLQKVKSEDRPPSLQHFSSDDNGLLVYQPPGQPQHRICIPDYDGLRLELLHDHHDNPTSGHLGIHKTQKLLQISIIGTT